jgi:methionyl-tRNA formyltransferase
VSAEKLIEILPQYKNGALVPKEQKHELATKAPMLKKEDGKIDWSKTAQKIYNQWRAYQPWPGIYTTWNGKLLKMVECAVQVHSGQWAVDNKPGTVLADGVVACGQNTYLQITTLQLEGKQAADIQSFLRGNGAFIGSCLE